MTSPLTLEVLSAMNLTTAFVSTLTFLYSRVRFYCFCIASHGTTDLKKPHFKCRLCFKFSLYVPICVKKIDHLNLHTRDSQTRAIWCVVNCQNNTELFFFFFRYCTTNMKLLAGVFNGTGTIWVAYTTWFMIMRRGQRKFENRCSTHSIRRYGLII
jgi:hypothetical protein